jgi:hypothetical protein
MMEFSICCRIYVEVFTLTLPLSLKGRGQNFTSFFFLQSTHSFLAEAFYGAFLLSTILWLKDPSPLEGEGQGEGRDEANSTEFTIVCCASSRKSDGC